MNGHSNLDIYVRFFSEQIGDICSLNTGGYRRTYCKLLLASLLDTLSKGAYPKLRKTKKRFLRFVRAYCGWSHGSRISLPHLWKVTEKFPSECSPELIEFASSLYRGWHSGSVPHDADDPEFESVAAQWPRDDGRPRIIGGIRIEDLTHYELLYSYRNCLTHEFRPQGYGIELDADETPKYQSTSSNVEELSSGIYHWELLYPVRFFSNLCRTGLENYRQYLFDKDIDPYESYLFSTYWADKLR